MIVTTRPVILIISVIGLMITIMHLKGFTKPVSHKLGCFLSDSFPSPSLKQTKRHQLSHGPAWLERSLSLCVLKCQLLQALDELPGSLATTVIMQPVVAPGLDTDVGGNTGSQH